MTRYQELCALYAAARLRADARRERCAVLVERFAARLRAYLQAPEDALSFCSTDEEVDAAGPLALRDALATEDGGWRVGIQIALRDPARPDTSFFVFIAVRVREDGGALVLSLSDEDPGRSVRPEDEPLLDAIAAEAHRRLAAWLGENLDRALGAVGAPEHYGAYL